MVEKRSTALSPGFIVWTVHASGTNGSKPRISMLERKSRSLRREGEARDPAWEEEYCEPAPSAEEAGDRLCLLFVRRDVLKHEAEVSEDVWDKSSDLSQDEVSKEKQTPQPERNWPPPGMSHWCGLLSLVIRGDGSGFLAWPETLRALGATAPIGTQDALEHDSLRIEGSTNLDLL
ncbi:unnamed protein product, partial [Pleuronectes platessa]